MDLAFPKGLGVGEGRGEGALIPFEVFEVHTMPDGRGSIAPFDEAKCSMIKG